MIRINLLPVRASKKREQGRQWVVLFSVVLVAVLVGNWFWYSAVEAQLVAVNNRISEYEKTVEQLNKIIGEVKNIEKEQKEIEQKLDTLRKLEQGRTGPVRVMDELTSTLPENVWLKNLELMGGGATFQGAAKTHQDVAEFMKKLKASRHFVGPVLRSSRQNTQDAPVEFQISCGVKFAS